VEQLLQDADESVVDCYRSLFDFDEAQKTEIEKNNSLAGIKNTTTNRLLFDFDNKANVEAAKQDTKILVDRLLKAGFPNEAINIYFTGSKGFHVEAFLTHRINHSEFGYYVDHLAKDLKTFDVKIRDAVRMVRIVNTRHPETGLFKIPLKAKHLEESVEKIREWAKQARNVIPATKEASFKLEIPKKEDKPVVDSNFKDEDIWSRKPSGWKNCKWSLLNGHFDSGERHQALMVLAATCRGLGYDKQLTYHTCKSAIEKQAKATGQSKFSTDELWENIIEKSTFGDQWKGGQYDCKKDPWLSKYCQSLGIHSCKKDKSTSAEPKILSDLTHSFKDYVKNIEKNTILTGIPELDKASPITIGTHVGILGAPGSGKTSLALDILNNTSKAGVKSVFASLDMAPNRMYEKVCNRLTNGAREKLYQTFQADQELDLVKSMDKEFGNVFFFDKSSPTVQDIKEYILACEEKCGEKIKFLMVDYFERVSSDFNDETQASKRVAGELQDLVNTMGIALVTLVQPNKAGLTDGINAPLYDYTKIKGSAFLYQSFRIILSLWRPFYTPATTHDDKFMKMALLKNDLGELKEFDFGWDGRRGRIYKLEAHERAHLEDLLAKQREQKEHDNGW